MLPPDTDRVLYELLKKREFLVGELFIIDEKIHDYLWDRYQLERFKKATVVDSDEIDLTGHG